MTGRILCKKEINFIVYNFESIQESNLPTFVRLKVVAPIARMPAVILVHLLPAYFQRDVYMG